MIVSRIRTEDLDFGEIPRHLLAREPRELRGEQRHDARMLVLDPETGTITHSYFRNITEYLRPGDIVVLNESQTIPSVFRARREDGGLITVYLCSYRGGKTWHVMLEPYPDPQPGFRVAAHGRSGSLTGVVIGKYPAVDRMLVMEIDCTTDLITFLHEIAKPVYSTYTRRQWDLEVYQNYHAKTPGSVEQPSAGRHFTPEILDRIRSMDVHIALLTLHTGMSNLVVKETFLDEHTMYEEYLEIDQQTADQINEARASGGRVLAVGTTVVRALETAASDDGIVRPYRGWTNLFISPGYRFKAIDMLLTNFHGARTTRLALAVAFAGLELTRRAYQEAVAHGYLFYEFGDTTLTLCPYKGWWDNA